MPLRRRPLRRLDRPHRPAGRRACRACSLSLRDKILPLADDTVVLPGHGPATTIGRERASNPYLRGGARPARHRPQSGAAADRTARRGAPHGVRHEQPTPMSGFPEWLPAQRHDRAVRARHDLRRTFELHGFAPIETRAVEPLDQLLRKGETSKEVYVLRRLQADAEGDGGDDQLGLHFDLTVPFARYVLENAGKLQLPVPALPDPEGVARRAAAGGPLPRVPAGRHRHRRPGHAGRSHHEVEMPLVIGDALARAADPAGHDPGQQPQDLPRASTGARADRPGGGAAGRRQARQDRPGAGGRAAGRDRRGDRGAGQGVPGAGRDLRRRTRSFVDAVRALGVERPAARRGPRRAGPRWSRPPPSTRPACCVADLRIARGLDYYTGTVYETAAARLRAVRLDLLRRPVRQPGHRRRRPYPGVGISIGVTRLLGLLFGARALLGVRGRCRPACWSR